MAFQTRKKIEVFRKQGNEKRDGSGRFNDTVLLVEVVEAERTEKFDAKMFFSVGWYEETPDGKLFTANSQGGKPKKLIGSEHLAGLLSALAQAQDFIDNGDGDGSSPIDGPSDDNIPF